MYYASITMYLVHKDSFLKVYDKIVHKTHKTIKNLEATGKNNETQQTVIGI